MSSHAAKDRAILARRINLCGSPSEIACDRCYRLNHLCFSMPGFKCSECTRLGRPCTNMSFTALDETIANSEKKMEEAIEEVSVAMAKYMRHKKIKQQAENRNRMRMLHLQHTLSAAGELDLMDEEEDCPAVNATMGLSPAVWGAIGLMNDALLPRDGTAVEGSGSS
jgi:hypothetical protein